MKKALSNRVNTLIIATTVIMSIIFFTIILNISRYSEKRELSQINSFIEMIFLQEKESITNEMFSNQHESLQETLRRLVESLDIVAGSIYTNYGSLISNAGDLVEPINYQEMEELRKRGSSFNTVKINDRHIAIYSSEIEMIGEKFGYIKLYYDITPLINHNKNVTILMMLIFMMKATAFIFLLNNRLKKIVIRPIVSLNNAMERIGQGNFEEKIGDFEILEFDQMGEVFNEMTKNLSRLKGNLEEIVSKRTRELKDSQHKLEIVLDTMPNPVFYKDKWGRYVGCNNSFIRLLGKTKQEIIGRTIFDIMDESYAKTIHQKEIEMFRRPESQSYETEFKTKDGVKNVIINKASIVSDDGYIEGLVAVVSDITERKAMEEEIRYNAGFQELIADISSDFINIDRKNLNKKIKKALSLSGNFFNSDRAFLYRIQKDGLLKNAQEWCADAIASTERISIDPSKYRWLNKKLSEKKPFYINCLDDLPEGSDEEREILEKNNTSSFVFIPIIIDQGIEGIFGFSTVNRTRQWADKEISLMKIIGNTIVDALKKIRIEEEVERSNRELKKISITDNLTKLYNRTKTDQVIEEEISRMDRTRSKFSVILFDIDSFKSINDRYGHQAGDEVLVDMSNIAKKVVRRTDVVGRWGGEEFIVICTETDIDGAITVAEKLREGIESHSFKKVSRVTCSFGVSESVRGDTPNTIVGRADEALYSAKKHGKNRVVFK